MRFTPEEYAKLVCRREEAAMSRRETKADSPPSEPPAPRKQPPPRMVASESAEQRAVIQWCQAKGYPFNRVFHIPNGGARRPVEARILKGEGVRAAVPDLCLPVPSGPYHGLYIEMKAKDGRLRPEQIEELHALAEDGYYAAVAYGWESAVSLMGHYQRDPDGLPANPLLTK